MAGYIGERARRKKRRIILFVVLLFVFSLFIYFYPSFQNNKSVPSDTLLPTDEEMESPLSNINVEELELKIFDKEQKIIFRDQLIKKLKDQIKIITEEKNNLIKSINKLNEEKKINISQNNEDIKKEVITANKKIKKIQEDNNNNILKFNNEKNELMKIQKKINKENELLKKEYKNVINKNAKLNDELGSIRSEISELENIIIEQTLIIKLLEDTSHHN